MSLFKLSLLMIFMISVFLLPQAPVSAASTYYLAPSGSDPSSCSGGTTSSPWKSWRKVKECASAGATIYLMPGNYTLSSAFNNSSRVDFNGQSGSPITLQAQPGKEREVFVYGPFEFYGSYGVIRNLDINVNTNSTGISIYANNFTMISNKIHDSSRFRCVNIFYPANNIRIDSNEVYNCGLSNPNGMGEGLEVTGGVNVTLIGNRIHDVLSGIEIKLGAKDIVIENNYIYNVAQTGIFGSAGTCGSSSCYGNRDLFGLPVTERYMAKNVMVRNNIIANVRSWAFIQPKGWVDYQIYNNTFYNSQGYAGVEISSTYWEMNDGIALGSGQGTACGPGAVNPCRRLPIHSKNGVFKNNIFVNWNGTLMELGLGETSGLTMDNNLYFKSDFSSAANNTFFYNGGYYSLNSMKARGFDVHSIISSPLFVSPGADFQLTPASPAINVGANLGAAVQYDYKWVTRPQGSGFDIGAFESPQGGRNTPTPVLPSVSSVTFNGQSLDIAGQTTTPIILSNGTDNTYNVPVDINYSSGSPRNLILKFIYQPAPTIEAKNPKYIFVTSNYFTGNLGGFSGADNKCQQAANNGVAALKGKAFKAWVATNLNSPAARMANKSSGPYILPNGTKVAESWADLTDSTILSPVNVTENGTTSPYQYAWSNVNYKGGITTDNTIYHCNGWTSNSSSIFGSAGSIKSTSAAWTDFLDPATSSGYDNCSNPHLLYCIEDTPVVDRIQQKR